MMVAEEQYTPRKNFFSSKRIGIVLCALSLLLLVVPLMFFSPPPSKSDIGLILGEWLISLVIALLWLIRSGGKRREVEAYKSPPQESFDAYDHSQDGYYSSPSLPSAIPDSQTQLLPPTESVQVMGEEPEPAVLVAPVSEKGIDQQENNGNSSIDTQELTHLPTQPVGRGLIARAKRNVQLPDQSEQGVSGTFFAVPKEGDDSQRSSDKFASRTDGDIRSYAMADGVSTSFLPARWAEIVVDGLVKRAKPFADERDFNRWLSTCRASWERWVQETWLPQFGQRTNKRDWSSEIARGAETTFLWCFFPVQPLLTNKKTLLRVIALGDTNLFLIRRFSEKYRYQTFPQNGLADFNATPDTLATAVELTNLPWGALKTMVYEIQVGDCLVLTTDALAKWVFLQLQTKKNPWLPLFGLADDAAFRLFVEQERYKGELEVDDTTLKIIRI